MMTSLVVAVGVVAVVVKPASAGIVMGRVAVCACTETHGLRMHGRVVAALAGRGMVASEIGWRAIHRVGVGNGVERKSKAACAGTNFLWRVVDTPPELLLQIWPELVAVTTNRKSSLNDFEHRCGYRRRT